MRLEKYSSANGDREATLVGPGRNGMDRHAAFRSSSGPKNS
jgi:hypothetical protein